MEIFLFCETGKKWENQKRVVYVKGGSCTCVFSWGSETPSGATPLGERTRARTSPTTCVDSWIKALCPTVVKAMLCYSAYLKGKRVLRCLCTFPAMSLEMCAVHSLGPMFENVLKKIHLNLKRSLKNTKVVVLKAKWGPNTKWYYGEWTLDLLFFKKSIFIQIHSKL
jgi:hypothetical protein